MSTIKLKTKSWWISRNYSSHFSLAYLRPDCHGTGNLQLEKPMHDCAQLYRINNGVSVLKSHAEGKKVNRNQ